MARLWPVLGIDLWLFIVCPKNCFKDCLDKKFRFMAIKGLFRLFKNGL